MAERQLQGDGFYDAIARFKHASSSSYLILAWQTMTIPPLTPLPVRTNTLWAPVLRKAKSTNTLRIPGPQEIKTRHTFTAEGKLIGFDLQAVKRYLSPGSCYHVLLRERDAVVLIQQMAGASVGNKRKRALAAGRSLLAFAPYVTATISITHLDELEDELLDFDMGRASPLGPSLAKSRSIVTLPGKVSRIVPRYQLADEPVEKVSSTSPSADSPKDNAHRMSVASSLQSTDTVFVDCEGSVDTLQEGKEESKAEERRTAADSAPRQKSVASPNRSIPPIPFVPQSTSAALRKSASAWVVSNDPAKGSKESRYENIVSDVVWKLEPPKIDAKEEEKRRLALDEAKRTQVLKRLTAEQNAWEGGIPSYYDTGKSTNDTMPTKSIRTSSVSTVAQQQRGVKRSPRSKPLPLFPPPALPLPASPKHTLSSMASSPIVFSFSTQAKYNSSAFPQDEDDDEDHTHPVITLGGHVRSRSRSKSVSSKIGRQSSRQAEEAANLSSMPPFLESLELARNKNKDIQQSGLEGESWISKRHRERSESDANVLGINQGWSVVEPDVIERTSDHAEAPIMLSKSDEALQDRHRILCLKLAEVQKKMNDMDKAERLRSIQWAGEAMYRQHMDAFERSQRESGERRRSQQAQEVRYELKRKTEDIQREQLQVKKLIEEASTYRGKVERAKRQRSLRMLVDDRERQHKQQQEQIKLKVKAERRADLRVELQTSAAPILAMGLMTVQSDDGLRRRRRYELHRDELLFFAESGSARRPSLIQSFPEQEEPLARIAVEPGSIIMIRDDSEASQTAHSFFVRYHDDVEATQEVLRAFTDTEAEKERLLIGLSMLSCYKLTDNTFES